MVISVPGFLLRDARRVNRAEEGRQDGDRQHDQQNAAADDDHGVAQGNEPQALALGRCRRDRGGVDEVFGRDGQ